MARELENLADARCRGIPAALEMARGEAKEKETDQFKVMQKQVS